jgi:chromosome segregation ATPase
LIEQLTSKLTEKVSEHKQTKKELKKLVADLEAIKQDRNTLAAQLAEQARYVELLQTKLAPGAETPAAAASASAAAAATTTTTTTTTTTAAAAAASATPTAGVTTAALGSARVAELESELSSSGARVAELESELESLREQLAAFQPDEAPEAGGKGQAKKAGAASGATEANNSRAADKVKATEKKLKEAEQQLKEAKSKSSRLEQQVAKLEAAAEDKGASAGGDARLKKELEELKKHKKKQDEETEKAHAKAVRALEKDLEELRGEAAARAIEAAALKEEAKELRLKAGSADALAKENVSLHEERDALAQKAVQLDAATKDKEAMEALYKEEQALRKKYFNMMEDMKGKIRVFARCRPFATYEKERGCQQAVTISDEYTVEVETAKGQPKQFVFDRVFGPDATQAQVFGDTQNLIQSAMDGYNVCVFAYGQTGSGKTWTMVGSKEQPGIVRASVREVFKYKRDNEQAGRNRVDVRLYMLELYLDNLVDLLYSVIKKVDRNSVPAEPPHLEIKKDKGGTIFVKGAQLITVDNEEELVDYFERANAARHTSATKMNAGSSRSHLIFSLVLENLDLASKKTSVGKLSLVDLAGSERQDKTGAEGEQLKEAQSINMSLSALGDVISALSTNEAFVPYRNNKLTQLMSDSLGGNAKTLMFVNISPADYNSPETASSLTYAARVKLITNDANKSEHNEELAMLRKIVREMKASGAKSALLDESALLAD